MKNTWIVKITILFALSAVFTGCSCVGVRESLSEARLGNFKRTSEGFIRDRSLAFRYDANR